MNSLHRIFYQGFTTRDLTEPLVSFDMESPATHVREFMEAKSFEIVGIRRDGLVIGYVLREELTSPKCADCVHEFRSDELIADTSSFADLVARLRDVPRVFVVYLGHVSGIVSRSDLQKPPMRMWLFGMISLIEMRMVRLIELLCPDEQWREYMSAARIAKAEALLAERTRRNQDLGLLDCLQFSDKGQIIARNEILRDATRFTSRRQVETTIKQLERLRNNLAHSQDIITSDWDTIVTLSADLDTILAPKFNS